jgi:hypothetical protein
VYGHAFTTTTCNWTHGYRTQQDAYGATYNLVSDRLIKLNYIVQFILCFSTSVDLKFACNTLWFSFSFNIVICIIYSSRDYKLDGSLGGEYVKLYFIILYFRRTSIYD